MLGHSAIAEVAIGESAEETISTEIEMKDFRVALRTYLLGDPVVNDLVGGVRIHNVRLPQDQVAPSVVYIKISETGDYHLLGDSGLGQMRVQLDSWAQDPDSSTHLANAVYDRLTGARGIVTINVGPDFVDMRGAFLANGRDDYDEVNQLYRASRDFIFWYGASE